MPSQVRLALALALSAAVAALEFWGGAAGRSLALTTDAVHVCMDVLALAVALLASIVATRRANKRKTFGYGRIEVLGALFNGAILLGATAVVAYQAVARLVAHATSHPQGPLIAGIAAIGLAANFLAAFTLHQGHHRGEHNVRAVLVHVAGDALGAIAVILGGLLIAFTHLAWIDPALSLVVAVIIIVGVVGVLRDAGDVLLEGVPPGIDRDEVERRLESIGGVVGLHDLHVWTIPSGSYALSAHVLLDDRRLSEAATVQSQVRSLLANDFGITHVTVELECRPCEGDC